MSLLPLHFILVYRQEKRPSILCILIDEVESLTASRQIALNGCEPSDAIRVVNALLTQLDSLKRHNNVLVLSTSNLVGALDPAFVDRADLQLHIPLPSKSILFQDSLFNTHNAANNNRGMMVLLDF